MATDPLKNYGNALADLLTAFAEQLPTTAATKKLLEDIDSGEQKIVVISRLVPFTVHACLMDDHGQPGETLFDLTSGELH